MKKVELKKRILNSVILAAVFMVVPIALDFWYLNLQPTHNYFLYESVEPDTKEFIAGEQPKFISNAEVFRTIDMRWNDVLYCNHPDRLDVYTFFSSYPSARDGVIPTRDRTTSLEGVQKKGWIYQSPTPEYPANCFIESSIVAVLEYGIEKKQIIRSENFDFIVN